MADITYKLEVFEGPLDLLLYLISKNKLNIYDIQVFELVEQYVAYIEAAKEQDMDIASEFLEMAARLIYLKTVSLLPKHEEADQLKDELTGELLEYKLCQEMAKKLGQMTEGFDTFVRVPTQIEPDKKYVLKHESIVLTEAYFAAVGRGMRKAPLSTAPFEKIVARKIVSVSSKIVFVLRNIWKSGSSKMSRMFEKTRSRSEIVATFLAVLELVKARRVRVDGNGDDTVISVIKERE